LNIWYHVTDLEAAQEFYKRTFGFEQVYKDEEDRWARMVREGGGEEGEEDVIATLEVTDIKAEADRLREAGLNVGVVLEIPGAIRLLDVFDPDGNRIQLSEDV